MPATSLRVSLLTMTPDAESLVYAAMRQCYSDEDAYALFEWANTVENMYDMRCDKVEELIQKVLASGHDSPIEHVSFSFSVSGVSRALSHQLVRHRIASYSQQSQRYVKADDFDYIVPPSIENCDDAFVQSEFEAFMNQAAMMYAHLVEYGIPAEDARFVLPNACATKLVVTMNARALLHFFEERTCARAQWEIRALANAMLAICKEHLPVVFSKAGPKCVRQGYCNEHKSCGRFPKREVNDAL